MKELNLMICLLILWPGKKDSQQSMQIQQSNSLFFRAEFGGKRSRFRAIVVPERLPNYAVTKKKSIEKN